MHKKILEAALFMSNKPLGLDEMGNILGVNSLGFVKQMLEELQGEYSGRGMEIVNGPAGWSMHVKQDILPRVAHLTPYRDLSGGMKKTLALVVYKEPVHQSDIIKTQGNKAYSYIKDLTKKGLIRAEKDGRTKVLYLTPEFERYFGEERKKVREAMEMELQKAAMQAGTETPQPSEEKTEAQATVVEQHVTVRQEASGIYIQDAAPKPAGKQDQTNEGDEPANAGDEQQETENESDKKAEKTKSLEGELRFESFSKK